MKTGRRSELVHKLLFVADSAPLRAEKQTHLLLLGESWHCHRLTTRGRSCQVGFFWPLTGLNLGTGGVLCFPILSALRQQFFFWGHHFIPCLWGQNELCSRKMRALKQLVSACFNRSGPLMANQGVYWYFQGREVLGCHFHNKIKTKSGV